MTRQGFGAASIIYSSLGWGRDFLAEGRSRGLKVVTEFYVRPSISRTYQAEFRAFPGWEADIPLRGFDDAIGSVRDPCKVSDFLVVPAAGVGDDVAEAHGFPRERIIVLPYGVADSFFQIQNKPIPGRILFAGNCCLGKGIHYLAMAAELLASKKSPQPFQFRVAGHASQLVRSQAVCRHLEFLGRVPRSDIGLEYQNADVFVLPTLSEGSASVTYEALAAGVPLVTTRTAGSVARHGVEAMIVPERDPHSLAEAIEQIVENRALRSRMAAAARERARDYSWERYSERLIIALTGHAIHS